MRLQPTSLLSIAIVFFAVMVALVDRNAGGPLTDWYDDSTLIAQREGGNFISGTGITVTSADDPANDRVSFTITATGGANSFSTMDALTGTDPVADSATDTLVLTSTGGTLTITGDSATDTINFEAVDLTCTGCLSATELGTSSVDTDELAANAVTAAKIVANAVDASEIAADAVGTSELDDGTDTPTAGECVVVASGGIEFEYVSCSGAGGGDSIEIEDGDNAGTFTAIDTTARFDDSGDLNFTFADGGAGGPDTVTATVRADSIALATDTTGAFVADLTGGAGISVSGGGAENATITVTTASGETDFLASGALTCGAGTAGRAQVHTTPLQYCDNAATPVLQYAAYGNSTGESTAAANDSVALTTDTTGNYVGSVADGTGIDGTAAGEGAVYTPTLDLTEISSTTWGAGAFTTMTFDAGAVDPIFSFASGILTLIAAHFEIDDQGELRWYEEDAGGTNYIAVRAPAAVTANITCTLEDDATPFDSCVTAPGGAQNLWLTIDASSGTDPVADTTTDTLIVTGGAGVTVTGDSAADSLTLTTDSTEADFLASGALTCGASTQGKAQVHTTPLQYCDNAATPALQYAAYASSTGVATSATALAADPTDCGAGTKAISIDAEGDLTCSQVDISADTNLTAGRSLTLTGDDVLADAELYTDVKGFVLKDFDADGVLTASDDVLSWLRMSFAVTVTEIWCETDTGTLDMDIEIDDGTPTGVNGSAIQCTSTGTTDGTFVGDTTAAAGDRFDFQISAVASAPTRVSVFMTFTKDD